MTQSAKLINGGLALILISSSGCAGNGLRNMFSRNETAGYKTLEELEEERIAAEKNRDDESGPRFASWLPFGKKTVEETESIAATDKAVDESEESRKSGWWKNPFRRQETIEADPFLENELPTEVVVAGKKDSRAKAEEVAPAAKKKATRDVTAAKDQAIETVSATTESETGEDDKLLVEKFEKHFQQSTESTVEAAGEGSDLLVAGIESAAASKKKAAASADNVNSAADKKLAEFEELLAAKKAAAANVRKEVQFEEESATAESAVDDFAESVAEASKSTVKQVRKTGKQADASVDEFDSLFEPVEKPVATKKKKTGSVPTSPDESEDVKVARADDVFGKGSVSGTGSGRQTRKPSMAGGWKGEETESNSASADANGKSGKGQQSELARKVIDTTVDQFAAMFSGARSPEGAPRATAPDADEWTAASQGRTGTGGRRGVPVRTASNGRDIGTALETPAGLREDAFFTGGNNPPVVTNLRAVPESEMNGAQVSIPAAPVVTNDASGDVTAQVVQLPSVFSFRNIVLVIGGIIVAALLFAPGRKKPTEANQLPVHG